ncbi:hypothetical protein [Sphingomonas sp. NIBR02145]|uniref:hypothetical protein n=1 Tax=Sphingomonas sp. NIBR02145 TaxID=3014784 RepID=UPI0022B56DCF|nr:hypothetical protein [Sphingomonas sp. NIBR02145]WHU00766.1 hypothetical protein O3305_11085 [Sphingomonas sp. NIBR02145]
MVAHVRGERMNLPLAPLIAAVAGGLAALGVAMIPVPALEALVMDSGLPSILAAAEPPLGLTARLAVALGAGAFVGAFMWLSAFILLGSRGLTIGGEAEPVDSAEVPVPVLRRADAHPDAPPRPPLLATRDLGKPFLEIRAGAPAVPAEPEDEHVDFDVIFPPRPISAPTPTVVPAVAPEPVAQAAEVYELHTTSAPEPAPEPIAASAPQPLIEQDMPIDFDQPLSAFDPQAIPAVPKPAPVPLAPLRRTPRPSVFDASERFEIFELTPPVRAHVPPPLPEAPEPVAMPPRERIVRPETDASVHALLERLERGVADKRIAPTSRAEAKQQERGLEEALVTLRNLVRRTA